MPKTNNTRRKYRWVFDTLETYFYDCTFATYYDPYIDEYVVIAMKEVPKLVASILLQGRVILNDGVESFYCLDHLSPQEQQAELRTIIGQLEQIGF